MNCGAIGGASLPASAVPALRALGPEGGIAPGARGVLRSASSRRLKGVRVIAVELFTRYGFTGALRWLHVLFGITWIGLLYYFNFVQVPSFAQLSPAARNEAIQKLARRALWWFRWAAVGTAIFGLLISGATEDYYKDYFKRANGASIFLGHDHRPRHAGQRLDVHLAATRRSSSPTRPTCSRVESRFPTRPPPVVGAFLPAARTRCSPSRCCGSWSARPTSTTAPTSPRP